MKIMICTPHYQDMVHVRMAQGVAALQQFLTSRGISNQWMTVGATYVQVGRDILSHKFLESDATHLLFIDSDVAFNPQDVERLIEADKDIVAGLYPVKDIYWEGIKVLSKHVSPAMLEHIHAKNMVHRLPEDKDQMIENSGKPIEVTGAATGFMLIRREVFEKYKEAYHDEFHYEWYEEGIITQFFKVGYLPERMNDPKHYGEDIWFCQMVRKLGIKIWVIPKVNLGHMGQHIYYGCHWCSQGQVIHPEKME